MWRVHGEPQYRRIGARAVTIDKQEWDRPRSGKSSDGSAEYKLVAA
jgi:hypothetical protein